VGEGEKTAESGIETAVESADLAVPRRKVSKERGRGKGEEKREWQGKKADKS
jgi:hypothetical protein